MALTYNGTSPTAIKYNGTDLTVLKYGTTAVWGKPYSLSISVGANTSVTVTRDSSPNQHASTGTLTSGSVVYYGDVIRINLSVSSGYKIKTSTINGTTFSNGQTFVVTSAISIVTVAEASASWHTVWTGTHTASPFNSNSTNSTSSVVETTKFKNLKDDIRTRITINFSWYEENNWGGGTLTVTLDNGEYAFYNQNTWNTNGTSSDFTLSKQNGSYCYIGVGECGGNGTKGFVTLWYRTLYTDFSYHQLSGVVIKQIEQYY